jgi:hypothetical protein
MEISFQFILWQMQRILLTSHGRPVRSKAFRFRVSEFCSRLPGRTPDRTPWSLTVEDIAFGEYWPLTGLAILNENTNMSVRVANAPTEIRIGGGGGRHPYYKSARICSSNALDCYWGVPNITHTHARTEGTITYTHTCLRTPINCQKFNKS